jgi:type IV secretion system protein VirB6
MKVASVVGAKVEEALQTYVNGVSASVSGSLALVAVTGLSIYFVFMAFAITRGDESNPLSKITKDFVRIGILLSMALVAGNYQSYVVEGANALTQDLSAAISRGAASSPWQAIDTAVGGCVVPAGETMCLAYDSVMMFLAEKKKSAMFGLPNVDYMIAFMLIALALMVIAALCVVPVLLATVGLALMLAVGPVFILLAIWPATQKFTQAWLSSAIGFLLTKVLVTAICTLIPSIFGSIIDASMSELQSVDAGPIGLSMGILVVAVALGFTALHASSMGAQLAGGGASLDSKGVGSMLTQLALAKIFSQPKDPKNDPEGGGNSQDKPGGPTNSVSGTPSMASRVGLTAGRATANVLNALGRKKGS